ncbi:MipA/OmpV family protein [Marinicella sp. W31]|uniref:MipA/OmpV family protein n=1 Tax=Marinicella sp. W31 TaxID=3023713 RepID=UPI0037575501
MQLRTVVSHIILSVSLMIHAAAHAQEPVDDSGDEIQRSWDFGIGLGYGELSNPFVASDDVPLYAILDFAWYGERFFFDNGDLGFTFVEEEKLGINAILNYSSERIYYSYFNELGIQLRSGASASPGPPFSIEDSPLIRLPQESLTEGFGSNNIVPFDIPDRDFAFNLGVEFLWSGNWGELQTQLTHDISSTHDGAELWMEYRYGWQWGDWSLRPSIGLSWKDQDLVDYYYGIDQDDNPGIPLFYDGDTTTNYFAGVSTAYRLNSHWSLVGTFRYERLGDEIRNSPLITEDDTTSVFAGLFYRF